MRGQLEATFVTSREITLGSIDRNLVMVQSLLGIAGKENVLVTDGNEVYTKTTHLYWLNRPVLIR